MEKTHKKMSMMLFLGGKENFSFQFYNLLYLLNFWQPTFTTLKTAITKYSRKIRRCGSDLNKWYFHSITFVFAVACHEKRAFSFHTFVHIKGYLFNDLVIICLHHPSVTYLSIYLSSKKMILPMLFYKPFFSQRTMDLEYLSSHSSTSVSSISMSPWDFQYGGRQIHPWK